MMLEQIIKEKKGTVIDVRSTDEFRGGHVSGSLNIPMNEIEERLDEIKKLQQPLVLCCASGARSGVVTNFLVGQDMICYNGGSWLDVNYLQSLHS